MIGPGVSALSDADDAHVLACHAMRALLRSVVRIDVERQWRDEGARDTRHLLQMRYGISLWEASRWLRAAHALEQLPSIARAFERGRLGLDKVLELCRFADASTDADLARWSASVSFSAVRRRADAEVRRTREEIVEVERARFLRTWYSDEGRRWGIEGELPAVDGAIVERAIERLAASIPAMPDEDDVAFADARRADALVALASARIADDPDPDRATIVIHAPDDAISGASVEGGPPVPRDTVERLLCTSRSQTVVEDPRADVIAMTWTTRLAPAWLLRQVRYRDAGCTFPGCGARRFTEAHHVTFWRDGGRTTIDNLTLICSFHHRLVHEYGWRLARAPATGELIWTRPDGRAYLRDGPRVRAPAEAIPA